MIRSRACSNKDARGRHSLCWAQLQAIPGLATDAFLLPFFYLLFFPS